MRKFYQKIVNHPKIIITFFLILAITGAVLRGMIPVNYDMTDYLPPDSPSTVALDVLGEEFEGGIPNARVMIKDVSVSEALEYKEQLENCVGVSNVMWLDDAENILQPLETMNADTVETYYKDRAALFNVTIEDNKSVEAVAAIRELIGEENALTGDAVSTADATTGTVVEVTLITVIGVLFVFFMLILTTTSWAEPLLIMIGLGVAIMINSGSNLIFGEISFVTNAAGMILQLAVSLDYSVFLIHRFEECRNEIADPKEAMVEALCKSTSSILSSGLTTVIGFLALIFMRFRIGPDLGRALAKGVAISLVTVFCFMSVLILSTYKWMEKTKHRSFLPSFRWLGKLVFRVMFPMVCVLLLLVVPAYLASNQNTFYYGASKLYGSETRIGHDTDTIENLYGKNDTYVAMVPRGDLVTEQELSDALHAIPQVKSILSYVDLVSAEIPMEYLEEHTLSQLVSENYSRFVITVDADHEGQETFALVETIRDTLNDFYPDNSYLAGASISTYDLMDTITADNIKVNLIAVGAVLLVLLLSMKSISLPVILVIAIESAVWINQALPYFVGNVVFYISYLIISTIQLGATVDYAILLTERYCEERKTKPKKQAVIDTISVVTPSILTSATVLAVIGFLMGKLSTHGVLAQLGMFLGYGTILSLASVLFALPGMLYLFDGLIQHTTWKLHFAPGKSKKSPKAEN